MIYTSGQLKIFIDNDLERKEFLLNSLEEGLTHPSTHSVKLLSEELSELDSSISMNTKILKVTLHYEGKIVQPCNCPEDGIVPPEDWTKVELAEYYVDEGINDTTLTVEEVLEIDRCDILSDVNYYIQNKMS